MQLKLVGVKSTELVHPDPSFRNYPVVPDLTFPLNFAPTNSLNENCLKFNFHHKSIQFCNQPQKWIGGNSDLELVLYLYKSYQMAEHQGKKYFFNQLSCKI